MDRMASLKVFGRVVECGGFTAAAKTLNMSVTMVGNHVQALEDSLGVRLLNRTTRSVSLTETGQFYYDRTGQVLAELEEIDLAAGALSTTPRGTLRVFTSSHIVRFLSPVFREYLRSFPDVRLELNTGERMADMIEGRHDLAFWTNVPQDASYVVRKLTSWRHMLVCSPEYLASHDAPKTPADLAGHNCLRYAYYPYGDEWRFLDPNDKQVAVKVSGSLLTTSSEALRYMVLSGEGVYLGPSFVLADAVADGSLVSLLPEYRPPEFAINAVFPNKSHLPTKTRQMIDLVAERSKLVGLG